METKTIKPPKEKASDFLLMYGKEWAIGVAKTLLWYARDFKVLEMQDYWKKVIEILKKDNS